MYPPSVAMLVALVAAALLVSCSDEDQATVAFEDVERGQDVPIVLAAGDPIVIGVSSALTGAVGPRGRQYRDAVAVAVERWKAANGDLILGHEIVVVAEDDGCTESDVARNAAERLLMRPGLIGAIGPQCSAGVLAALDTYAAAGVVTISGSATASTLAEDQPSAGTFFRTAYRNDAQGLLISVFLVQDEAIGEEGTYPLAAARAAYLVDDGEAYGIGLADDTERAVLEQLEDPEVQALREQLLGNSDLTITRASVQQGAVDFSDLAAEVAEAAPEAVLFAGFNPEAGLLLRQLRDAGWVGAYVVGDAVCGTDDCEFLAALGDLAEGVGFSGCSPELPADFVTSFAAVHGDPPTAAFVAHYADGTTILLDAVAAVAEARNGELIVDPRALRDAVASTQLSGGVSGDVVFNAAGDRAGAEFVDLQQYARDLGLVPCQVRGGTLGYFR